MPSRELLPSTSAAGGTRDFGANRTRVRLAEAPSRGVPQALPTISSDKLF
jgi:hypothetical protein